MLKKIKKISHPKPAPATTPKFIHPGQKKKGKIKKIFFSLFFIIALAGSGFYYFQYGNIKAPSYTTAFVKRGTLVQTVSETGVVKSPRDLDLKFISSGTVKEINVKVGQEVKEGDILARLDDINLKIKEQESIANLNSANASLAKLQAGARAAEIAVSQANVSQAENVYNSAKAELENVKKTVDEDISQAQINLNNLISNDPQTITAQEQAVNIAQVNLANAKSTYQNAIKNKQDTALVEIEAKLTLANTALANIDRIISDTEVKKILSVKNSSYLVSTGNAYQSSLELIKAANNFLAAAKTVKENTNQALISALSALSQVFSALNYCYSALESSIASSDVTQAALDGYKTNISSQSTIISAGILTLETAKQNLADASLTYSTNISSAEEDLGRAQAALSDAKTNAKNILASAKVLGDQKIQAAEAKISASLKAWQVAQANLAQIKSPPSVHDVSLARSQIKQAEANLDLVRRQIAETILAAPISGVITKVNYKVGEQANSSQVAISLLGQNNFEIEVLISETDITKIVPGDKAEITLDAFGDEIKFFGSIDSIDPAETIISDVIYYKTIVYFAPNTDLSRVKHGMTANLTITTFAKDDVLIVLGRAIVEKNGGSGGNGNGERKQYLRILKQGAIEEAPVQTGLRGDGGYLEIIGAEIKEGDEVILYINQE